MATTTAPQVANEPPPVRPGGPRYHSGKAFFWGIVFILAAGFLAWLLIGYFGTDNFEDLDQKRVKERQEILKKRIDEDWKLLNEPPSYLDKEKGKIRVPLGDAMQMAMLNLQNSKPRVAYPATGDHAPQPAAAPASPDKGKASPKNGNINPSASNPTLNQALPAPAAQQAPTPVAPAQAATPPPANGPGAPGAAATPQVGTAATGTPAPSPAPASSNNALNPGPAPGPGAQPQPSPKPPENTESSGVSPTPSGAQPQPATEHTPRPDSPTENQKDPGATPGGTPS